jgi:PPOX class probable F420-dependent enzyme
MTWMERIGRVSDRMFDRLRDKRAFTLTDEGAIDADLDVLRGHKYAVLVTFRRNGDAVPSPVWPAVDEAGLVYIKTRHDAGKVKRLRRDSRVLVAPSNARGKPAGRAIKASGRVLSRDEWAHAERVLAAAYGSNRAITERLLGGPEELAAYIEIRRGR